MNCSHCSKPFTCGCQKHVVNNGVIVHKTCLTEYNSSSNVKAPPKQSNLELQLAAQQIKDLRNK